MNNQTKPKESTMCFLIKRNLQGEINSICIAMKKRGFGVGRLMGVGGKVNTDENETIEHTLKRETEEEISVKVLEYKKVGYLEFRWPTNPANDMNVHTYFCEKWEGEPVESEEMKPVWYQVKDIPYSEMWPDNKYWLPEVISDKLVLGLFHYEDNEVVDEPEINIVEKL